MIHVEYPNKKESEQPTKQPLAPNPDDIDLDDMLFEKLNKMDRVLRIILAAICIPVIVAMIVKVMMDAAECLK